MIYSIYYATKSHTFLYSFCHSYDHLTHLIEPFHKPLTTKFATSLTYAGRSIISLKKNPPSLGLFQGALPIWRILLPHHFYFIALHKLIDVRIFLRKFSIFNKTLKKLIFVLVIHNKFFQRFKSIIKYIFFT